MPLFTLDQPDPTLPPIPMRVIHAGLAPMWPTIYREAQAAVAGRARVNPAPASERRDAA